MKKGIVTIAFLATALNLSGMEENRTIETNHPAHFDLSVQKRIRNIINKGVQISNLVPNSSLGQLYKDMQEKIKTDFENLCSLTFYNDLIKTIKEKDFYNDYLTKASDITGQLKNNPESERLRLLANLEWLSFRTNARCFTEKMVENNSSIKYPKHFEDDGTKKRELKFAVQWHILNKDLDISEPYYSTVFPTLFGAVLYFGYLKQVEQDEKNKE